LHSRVNARRFEVPSQNLHRNGDSRDNDELSTVLSYPHSDFMLKQAIGGIDEDFLNKKKGSTSKLVLDFMYQIVHGYIRPEVLVRNVPGSG